jgi:T5SS/PEP-CTERM-associated repeat protein
VANALIWAAGAGNNLRLSLVLNASNTLFHPGVPISFAALPTNVPPGGVTVQFFTNNVPISMVAVPPFQWTWSNAPVGIHGVTAVAQATNGEVVASRPITVTVDSRMTAVMTSPIHGSVVAVPTNLFLAVAITNADAAIAQVQFLRDGAEILGTVRQPPYQLTFGPIGAGKQNLSARVTDVLGAVRVTETVQVTGINPLMAQSTRWLGTTNVWTNGVHWSAGIPRPQDSAWIEDGGDVVLPAVTGTASNLWVGATSRGRLVVDGGALNAGRLMIIGESAGSTGSMVLRGAGSVTTPSLFVGLGGSATFEQEGGTVTAAEFGVRPDGAGTGLYTLKAGTLATRGSFIGGPRDSGFRQSGGVHRVDGGLVVGTRNARTGFYTLSGGVLDTVVTRIGAGSLQESELRQTGGSQVVREALRIGAEGDGRMVVLGGTVDANELNIDSGGALEVAVGRGSVPIHVNGRAALNGRLVLHYKAGFIPNSTNEVVVMSYGSRSGQFISAVLPPDTNGVTWSLEYRATRLVLVPQPLPNLVVISPLLAEAEPGLFSQIVRIVNYGRQPLQGARVYVPGLPAAVQLFNMAGMEGDVPYAEYGEVIAPGRTVEFILQFLSRQSDRMAIPAAVVALGESDPDAGIGSPLRIVDPEPVAGGGFTLRFHPEANRAYRIEYSSDLIRWSRAAQTLVGTGSVVRWTDDGPPRTASAPGPVRFYRVVPAP